MTPEDIARKAASSIIGSDGGILATDVERVMTEAIQDERDKADSLEGHALAYAKTAGEHLAELTALKARIEAKAVTWDVGADAESAPAYMRQAARDNAAGCRALLDTTP